MSPNTTPTAPIAKAAMPPWPWPGPSWFGAGAAHGWSAGELPGTAPVGTKGAGGAWDPALALGASSGT
jgi:hypothetical protein